MARMPDGEEPRAEYLFVGHQVATDHLADDLVHGLDGLNMDRFSRHRLHADHLKRNHGSRGDRHVGDHDGRHVCLRPA
jgi:hypothetical protein